LVLQSQTLRLHHGSASLVLPYRPEYKDQVTVAAYLNRGDEDSVIGTHTVLFPRKRDLKLDLRPAAKSFKPGELARVSFRAFGPEGRSVESALGVVVLDKAVEERIRTDQDFDRRYGSFNNNILGLLGYGPVDAVSSKALKQLDMSRAIPADL